MDPSTRNVIADLSNVLLCGWKNCRGEFYDFELFVHHVDSHAMEDVTIPVMSKEMLKKVKFAKCEWVNCNGAYNTKSHLKAHLYSHTQKKVVGCPICGLAFSTKNGFINHCYRQETSTKLENSNEINYGHNLDEEPEGILTIDEDANPSSILIHFPQNLQKIIPSQAIINSGSELTTEEINSTASSSKKQSPQILHLPNQNVALLLNVNLSQANTSSDLIGNSNSNESETSSNNLLQFSLTSSSEEIVREFQCNQCTKSFNTNALLKEHLANHLRRYQCTQCSYSAPYPARLKEHVLFRHTESRNFECKFCDNKFKTKFLLRRHIQRHDTSEKGSEVCFLCNNVYTSFQSLNRHIRTEHLNEQIIFACHLCEREYSRGNNLSRHLVKNHQLKPSNGWTRFEYEKKSDGVYRLKK